MRVAHVGLFLLALAVIARADGLVVAPATSPGLPFTLGPATTVITGPVDKRGLPDYAAALNERYGKGVTAENNAAVEWLRLMGDDILADDERGAVLTAMGTTPAPTGTVVWSDEEVPAQLATTAKQLWQAADYPGVDAFVKQRGPLLDRLVELSGKTHWFWPAVTSSDGLQLYTGPRYAGVSDLLRALASRSTERAAAKDFQGFERDILALLHVSQLLGTGSTILERVMGTFAQSIAADALSTAADGHVFTRDQWKQLADAAADVVPIDDVEPLDILERCSLVRAQELAAVGAFDHLSKDPDAVEDFEMDAIIGHRKNLDWNLILEHVNNELNECVMVDRMAPGPARDEAVKSLSQRLDQERQVAGGDNLHFDPRPGESWQAYSARIQGVDSIFLATAVRGLATREDQSHAAWNKLHALLVSESQAR